MTKSFSLNVLQNGWVNERTSDSTYCKRWVVLLNNGFGLKVEIAVSHPVAFLPPSPLPFRGTSQIPVRLGVINITGLSM